VLEKFAALLGEVLNVKRVRLLNVSEEAHSFRLSPVPGCLGPKHKDLYPLVCAALTELDTEGAARALLDGHALVVNVQGKAVKILPDEVEVHPELAPGGVVVGKGGYLAILQTDQPPELVQEGLAREVIHLVQGLRKQAGLEYTDRIDIYIESAPVVLKAVQIWEKNVMQATGANTIKGVSVPKGGASAEAVIGKAWMKVGIGRASLLKKV
jgi:isoleucyl-tRNA synthetase